MRLSFFSGSQHAKVHMMCSFMKLGCSSATQFVQVQSLYLLPTIKSFWVSLEEETIQSRQEWDVVICGKSERIVLK